MVYDTHTYLCCQLSTSELIYKIQLEYTKTPHIFPAIPTQKWERVMYWP
jgi:hypothetical protein